MELTIHSLFLFVRVSIATPVPHIHLSQYLRILQSHEIAFVTNRHRAIQMHTMKVIQPAGPRRILFRLIREIFFLFSFLLC